MLGVASCRKGTLRLWRRHFSRVVLQGSHGRGRPAILMHLHFQGGSVFARVLCFQFGAACLRFAGSTSEPTQNPTRSRNPGISPSKSRSLLRCLGKRALRKPLSFEKHCARSANRRFPCVCGPISVLGGGGRFALGTYSKGHLAVGPLQGSKNQATHLLVGALHGVQEPGGELRGRTLEMGMSQNETTRGRQAILGTYF